MELFKYFTVTSIVTVLVFPFFNVTFALMVAVPAFFAVTLPFLSTLATELLEDEYVILLTFDVSNALLSAIVVFLPFFKEWKNQDSHNGSDSKIVK